MRTNLSIVSALKKKIENNRVPEQKLIINKKLYYYTRDKIATLYTRGAGIWKKKTFLIVTLWTSNGKKFTKKIPLLPLTTMLRHWELPSFHARKIARGHARPCTEHRLIVIFNSQQFGQSLVSRRFSRWVCAPCTLPTDRRNREWVVSDKFSGRSVECAVRACLPSGGTMRDRWLWLRIAFMANAALVGFCFLD